MTMRALELLLAVLACLAGPSRQREVQPLASVFSFNEPNCIDKAFLVNGGCGPDPVNFEITDKVIAIANCFLKQLPHLRREPIECKSGDMDCIHALLDYQKAQIKSVWMYIDLYCSVHKQRLSKNLYTQSFKNFVQAQNMLSEQLEQTSKMNRLLADANQKYLSELEELKKSEIRNKDLQQIRQESALLSREVEALDSRVNGTASLFDIAWASSYIDLYSYLVSFIVKMVWVMLHSSLSSKTIDVSAYEISCDLAAGLSLNYCAETVGAIEFFGGLKLPAIYVACAKMVCFFYFSVLKFVFCLLRNHPLAREDKILDSIRFNIHTVSQADSDYSARRKRPADHRERSCSPSPASRRKEQPAAPLIARLSTPLRDATREKRA